MGWGRREAYLFLQLDEPNDTCYNPAQRVNPIQLPHWSDLIIDSGVCLMFDNDDPAQRKALIRALQASGLDAAEYSSGGGIMHVIVPLLDDSTDPATVNASDPSLRTELETGVLSWPHSASLLIATGSAYKPCDVGLFGYNGRTGEQVELPEWEVAKSLQEAEALFQRFWNERDRWLGFFLDGKLDVR